VTDYNTIYNRLEKNLKHKKKWANREKIEAFRLYEKDIPDFPFIVDIYKDQAVIFEKRDDEIDAEKFNHFEFIISAVKELLKINESDIIIKSRFRQKGAIQYTKLEEKNEYITITEGAAKYLVNLHDYLDTGLFLDHRPLRKIIYQTSENKKVLNLFSYTGSISVMAALGKARSVTSVDMSQTYQDWAKRNFEVNELPLNQHNFIVDSALEYLKKASSRFDIIILDPPTFSNSKKMTEDFEVEKDQVFLIHNCMRLLDPKGVLYFSNNKRKFKIDPTLLEKYHILDITAKTIPEDYRDLKVHQCFKITHKNQTMESKT
jgi:23S rRNA (cytosine1962-C5)-methyltransferase